MVSTATTLTPAKAAPVSEYVQLKRLIESEGLLEKKAISYMRAGIQLLVLLAAVGVGVFFMRDSWLVLLLALPAAFVFGQLGFLAHDATHNQIFNKNKLNYIASLFSFNFLLGGSRGWWADKHNAHHAQPNRIGTDPDIEGGVIALNKSEVMQAKGISKKIMRHQEVAIGPLLSLSVLQTLAYSVKFLFSPKLRNAAIEAALIAIHWTLYLGGLIVILGPGKGLLFALAHLMILGVYLGGVFLPNHVGMKMIEPDEKIDFLERQVLTSRNLTNGWATDFIFGALSCQIEHHLFPTMPRYNLRAAAPIVKRFCEEREILYVETKVNEAYRQVHDYLREVALPLKTKAA